MTKVTKQNYREFKYQKDKRLSKHTDEELVARKFHLKDIYRGMKGPMKALLQLQLNQVDIELSDRKKKNRKK